MMETELVAPITGHVLVARVVSKSGTQEARLWQRPAVITTGDRASANVVTTLRAGVAELFASGECMHRFFGTEKAAADFYAGLRRAIIGRRESTITDETAQSFADGWASSKWRDVSSQKRLDPKPKKPQRSSSQKGRREHGDK